MDKQEYQESEQYMKYSKKEIVKQITEIGIQKNDVLLIHSSMKAIGETENGADTILDAFIEYLDQGLLVFPTHTWATINNENNIFDPAKEPSCVGILSNLFLRRPGVLRSWHPTHSVAALGKSSMEFVRGEENRDTPCHRSGCWGKLYDMGSKILFIGCSLKTNTILHGVEEWNNIPKRLTEKYIKLKILTPEGRLIDRPVKGHDQTFGDISKNYDKIEKLLLKKEIAVSGMIGEAKSYLCNTRKMVETVSSLLKKNPDLFLTEEPLPEEWY
jgi:aminoglycoside 3-N-acetyltransferase